MKRTEWNWNEASSRYKIVVQKTEAVAIYKDADGYLVIRQQDSMGNDDAVITIPMTRAQAIIETIKKVASESD